MAQVALKPVQSRAWRPGALGGAVARPRPSHALGQASTNNLLVEVVDHVGRPIRGIPVESLGVTVQTDSRGMATFPTAGAGKFDVKATYDGLTVGKTVSADEIAKGYTVFLQFPICVMDPLIRPIDFAIFGAAAGMIAAGTYWKLKPLQMTGEIALGAGIFGLIYRLQCV